MNNILSSISTIKNFQFNSNRTTCNDYLYNALNDAVESMEKQIPKKMLNCKYTDMWHGKCPHCGETLHMLVGQPYCMCCGQNIIWSENGVWKNEV